MATVGEVASKVVNPADLPAGHERDEASRIAADVQAEVQETRAQGQGLRAFSPEALKLDRELAGRITGTDGAGNILDVKGAQKGYVYRWVWCMDKGRAIDTKMIDEVQVPRIDGRPIWELVRGEDAKECPEDKCVTVLGVLRIKGDVCLMRAQREFVEYLERREIETNVSKLAGVAVKFQTLADDISSKSRHGQVTAHVIQGQTPRDYFRQRAQTAGGGLVRGQAAQLFASQLRAGTVPGIAPGAELKR